MTYSCTDLADAVLGAADKTGLCKQADFEYDDEDFDQDPSAQADYIMAVIARAMENRAALRKALEDAGAALDQARARAEVTAATLRTYAKCGMNEASNNGLAQEWETHADYLRGVRDTAAAVLVNAVGEG